MRPWLQLGTIVLALSLAATASLSDWGAGDSAARDPRTQTQWLCASCAESCCLTAAEVRERAGGAYDGKSGLPCSACRSAALYLARTCGKCKGLYHGPEVLGAAGHCPRCGPSNDLGPSLRNYAAPREVRGPGPEASGRPSPPIRVN